MKSIAHQGVQSPFNIKKKLNENGLSLREKAQMVPKIPKIHNLFSDLSLLSHSHDTYDCDNQSFPYYSSDIEQRSITNAPKTHLHPIERSGKPKPWQAPISTEIYSFDSMDLNIRFSAFSDSLGAGQPKILIILPFWLKAWLADS